MIKAKEEGAHETVFFISAESADEYYQLQGKYIYFELSCLVNDCFGI